MLLGNILWFPGWLAGVVYLNFAEDEIQFPVLLRLLTGVERAGLGEELHQLLLFSLTELPAFRLGVHPFGLITNTSDWQPRLSLLPARESQPSYWQPLTSQLYIVGVGWCSLLNQQYC